MPGVPVSEEKMEAGLAFTCMAAWNEALPGTGLETKVNALKPAEKRCMVAWMFHTCVRSFEQIDDNASETRVVEHVGSLGLDEPAEGGSTGA